MRVLIAVTAMCLALPSISAAQKSGATDPFVGSFRGPSLAITLERSGGGYVGVGTSANGQYRLQAQKIGQILLGSYLDRGVPHAFQIAVQGNAMQFGSDGVTVMLQRQSGSAAGAAEAGAGPRPGGSTGGQGVAAGPQDRQLSQLLLSSRWCAFSYSQVSGTSHTERVQFFPNGTVTQSTGGETYNSGQYGTASSQSRGGMSGMWRVQGGMLVLSQDGVNWTPQMLQVTRNSSGYPIVHSGGKEYSQCN